ncbi:single-stranded-DNA-specific exonuclease RecJ [Patescibacteria group bacterium]|nr:single-stranded-DNA-specific exonuclease RecJ [Patescibacteria group bacterium]
MTVAWHVRAGGRGPVTSQEELQRLLLDQRGVAKSSAERFLSPSFERDFCEPRDIAGVVAAVDRIYQAIEKKERILIWGDYDADGVTSTAIVVAVMQQLSAQVTPYLPNRNTDGYGLNGSVLEQLAPEIDLLISVDCGITAGVEIAELSQKGIDVIVVDHHELPDELPAASAIVHPMLSAKLFAGGLPSAAGLALKLAVALLADDRSSSTDPDFDKKLLDLAAIGTLADVVPLLGENRAIVHFGLQMLRHTQRPGLIALLKAARVEAHSLTEHEVIWKLIPRLNAAGRMQNSWLAFDLLLAKTEEKAAELVGALEKLNRQRRVLSQRVLREAEAQVDEEAPVIFVHNTEWEAGVVGVAAGRLAEKYSRPAIVIGGNGKEAVGSARSFSTINILSLLQAGEDHLIRVGGHAKAAGFTAKWEALDQLGEVVQQAARDHLEQAQPHSAPQADAIVEVDLITLSLVRVLAQFAPYGEGNARPALAIRNLLLVDWREVGRGGAHIKFTFWREHEELDGIGFGLGKRMAEIKELVGTQVDVIGYPEENAWRGRHSLQLVVEHIAPAGEVAFEEQSQ